MKNKNQQSASPQPITLIATIGSSPAVLTEALYELHRQGMWPVQRIVIITTEHGRQRLEQQLFTSSKGAFYRFCEEYGIPFQDIHIDNRWIIPVDEQGIPLYDIRTREDDQRFAEAVQHTVREHCQNNECRVFGLLSGGRKTMGAHLVSAMQLFARQHDCLLHVLVSEPYDMLPGFFYPTPDPVMIKDRAGNSFDASGAEVTLIDIPFLRLRSHLSETNLDFDQSYPELLQQITQHLRVAAEKPVRTLSINLSDRNIYLNGVSKQNRLILPARQLALTAYMAAKSILNEEIASVNFPELEHPFEQWMIHLLYYAINRVDAESDIWLTRGDYRRVSKIKTDLKSHLRIKLQWLKWEPKPRLHHLFEFTENVRYADQAEHRLLIPPQNLSLLYSGDVGKLEDYLAECQELSKRKNKLPEMSSGTYKTLCRLIGHLHPPRNAP